MIKINKKRIAILIVLIIIIIVEMIAFGLSRAKNIKEISVSIIDTQQMLKIHVDTLNAIDGGESGYYIILPETINSKFISKYIINEKQIYEDENGNEIEETEEIENKVTTAVEKVPGDKIYLTQTELESKAIELSVVYDTKSYNSEILYKKQLEEIINNKKIVITGYMPAEAEIEILDIEEQSKEKIEDLIKEKIDEDAELDEILRYKNSFRRGRIYTKEI